MDVVEEEFIDYESIDYIDTWTENDIYVIGVIVILLPAMILSILTAICVYHSQKLSLKLKTFVKHLMVSYFILSNFDMIEALRFHTDLLDVDRLSYWLIYPIIASTLFAKYLIIFALFAHRENMSLCVLKNFFKGIWCCTLIYMLILGVLTIYTREYFGSSLIIVPSNINLSIFIITFITYILIVIIYLCKSFKKFTMSNENEKKIRFSISAIALSCSLIHIFIENTVPLLWPYLSLYFVDTLEIITIVIFLIKIDLDFTRMDVEQIVSV